MGQTLTATIAPSGATATYQWKSADTEGGSYTNIDSATTASYELTASESGKYIKVEAKGAGKYSGTVLSAATAAVTAAG